jgi:prefoldin alpha subunit
MKDDVQKKIVQFQILEANLKALQEREELINERLAEIENTKAAIEELKKTKPGKTLIPIGSGNFISGKIDDTEELIIGVGSGVAIKKKREDAAEILDSKFKEFEKDLNELRNHGTTIAFQLAKLQEEIEKSQE